MEDSTLMSEGLTLMLTGMGFVFVFLTVLVLVTTLMSWIITRYEKVLVSFLLKAFRHPPLY